ncbi:MAG: TetR/AcrR family transcriptional regulator [Alphaproteobacteria bacterium]|nr:TetR/AcrR family transcriptional regulator [Alphaproteobacteria bacterium]MBV9372010.1 TetR/AcrR family transcriptional regulator [Alphaproteobacteria bacterium]MBV9901716.1 TetR/AcrR family transcriptional regulator [Alphaproteobacteria bacterium]
MADLGGSAAAAAGEKEPRTERGRKTLRRLIDAAAAEFGERGYHEAAITGITRRAGVALGTFYTYFESKEEVFRALVREMSRATRVHVAEAVKDARDRLAAERLGLEAFISFVRKHPELYRIIEEAQFVAHDVYREHYLTFAEAYRRNLAGARERNQISAGSGDVAETDEARAWALIGMSVFLGMRYGIWDQSLSPARVADIALQLMSDGLRFRSV